MTIFRRGFMQCGPCAQHFESAQQLCVRELECLQPQLQGGARRVHLEHDEDAVGFSLQLQACRPEPILISCASMNRLSM